MNIALNWKGGDQMAKVLEDIRKRVEVASQVKVGFLEGATYPDGTPVAYVAAINEFGAVVPVAKHEIMIYRKLDKNGDFAKNGRFVKRAQSNFATTHNVDAHSITIPSRPFFRDMITKQSPGWGVKLAKLAKQNQYDMLKTWGQMGDLIKGQLQASIRDFSDPPNAASTAAKKGFNKPLTDTQVMLNAADYEVG